MTAIIGLFLLVSFLAFALTLVNHAPAAKLGTALVRFLLGGGLMLMLYRGRNWAR